MFLEELSVRHQLFGIGVGVNLAVGAVEVEASQVVVAMEELEADQVVGFPPIGDGHGGRDVGQPPPDREVVLWLLRRLGRCRDEARELRNVTNPETADVDRQHPGCLRNVQMVFEADVAPSADPESWKTRIILSFCLRLDGFLG